MQSNSDRRSESHARTYSRAECVVFSKTKEGFGGLSNMASGFLLRVNGIRILTSEALYQACRFPHLPEVQQLIIGQSSPMTAKMKSKPYRKDSRPDWDRVRTKIMRWCLRVKLAQNWSNFSELLLETGDRPIVEQSRKDDFWGAKPVDEGTLVGMNVLGRLLMELREAIKSKERDTLLVVAPLVIPDFCLFGQPIGVLSGHVTSESETVNQSAAYPTRDDGVGRHVDQSSLFDGPAVREGVPADYVHANPNAVSIGKLKSYLTNKSTAPAWLGNIPEHWQYLPGRACFAEKKIPNRGLQEKTVLSLSYGRIVVKPSEKLHGLVPESFETYQIVDPGDIVIRPTDLQNDWNSLRFGFVKNRGIITSAYLCFRAKEQLLPEYTHLLLHTYDLMKVFYGLGSGLRQNLDWSDFKYLPCLVPPLDEQAAIVRFLDWANGRLERAIRAKRKVIALLNEQKQAIIHRAVTRGLDPAAPLKPSGVPWLGDIPRHWEVRRVKQVVRILRGKFTHRPRNDPSFYDGQYPFIQTGVVAQASKFITGYSQTLNEKGLAVSKMFPSGTLVMTIAANIGEVALLTFDACFPDSIVGFVPSKVVDRDYLYLVFKSMKPELLREAPVNTQGNLNVERIGAMAIPLPLRCEQEKIAKNIEEESSSFDTAISRLECEMKFLSEYRTRLIADVVTGKLDVREATRNLPDDVAAMEIADADAEDIDTAESEAEAVESES